MSDQRAVNQETVDTLSVMFPHIFQDVFSTYLRDYSFDEVVELMQLYYPQNDDTGNQNDNSNDQNDNSDSDSYYYSDSESISSNVKDQMILEIQNEYPDFDEEDCLIFLEDSDYDIEKAKKEAFAIIQLYLQYERSNNEASGVVYFDNVNRSSMNPTPDKKAKKKKQIITDNLPMSYTQATKKAKKIKKKTIPSIKSTENQSKSNQQSQKDDGFMNPSEEMFELLKKFPYASQTDLCEVLLLSQNDTEIASKLMDNRMSKNPQPEDDLLEQLEANKKRFSSDDENDSEGTQNNDNDDENELNSSEVMFELLKKFPYASQTDLREVLSLSQNDTEIASKLMENRMSKKPQPEGELLSALLRKEEEQGKEHRARKTKKELKEEDDEDDNFYRDMNKRSSKKTSFGMKRTNRMPQRHSKSENLEIREIDLHGENAVNVHEKVYRALEDAERGGIREIHFITGRGRHSQGNIPILRPLVYSLCKKRGYKPLLSRDKGCVICKIK
ncbi:hypothetical protein M9Y10_008713 [Tritrichomonas musculus]|uniref:Smr domain-containing protein n=1 Tax=Tritrichomonas musculus TaxID=1915356 RepID=A0ABR2IZ62_9EUKA